MIIFTNDSHVMQSELRSDSLSLRIQSVDFIRGLVMILMAIDHVRVYSGLPAGGPEPGIFFTRWITHFCAPVFVFLSGTSAFLYGVKLNDRKKLMKYLLSRGILLVILELTLIRFFWTFNLDFSKFVLAGVIWMIGWCMIILSLLIRLRPRVVGIIGLAIIFFQNLFALVPQLFPESSRVSFGYFWEFIYSSGLDAPPGITILYVLIPWVGVMAAGYGFGSILQGDETRRKKILVMIGLTAIVSFIVFGSVTILMNTHQDALPFLFQLLNQRKYPASQLYLLMTLGPAILLMPYVEKIKGAIGQAILTIGRVPFFYYLTHILLIHLSALIVQLFLYGQTFPEGYATAPYAWVPEEHRWSLPLLYLVFFIDVALLYFLCRWYEQYKFSHPEKSWLKFI
jgi:uncharacterized membrane protein